MVDQKDINKMKYIKTFEEFLNESVDYNSFKSITNTKPKFTFGKVKDNYWNEK